MPYACEISKTDEKKVGRAFGKELNVSPRHVNEICRKIRGMMAKKAVSYLEKVQEKKAFVPFMRYQSKIPHRSGGIQGRYPVKASKQVGTVVKNAIANAEHKGLDADKLKIIHASGYKSFTAPRKRPKGMGGHGIIHQGIMHSMDMTNVEIIVKEM